MTSEHDNPSIVPALCILQGQIDYLGHMLCGANGGSVSLVAIADWNIYDAFYLRQFILDHNCAHIFPIFIKDADYLSKYLLSHHVSGMTMSCQQDEIFDLRFRRGGNQRLPKKYNCLSNTDLSGSCHCIVRFHASFKLIDVFVAKSGRVSNEFGHTLDAYDGAPHRTVGATQSAVCSHYLPLHRTHITGSLVHYVEKSYRRLSSSDFNLFLCGHNLHFYAAVGQGSSSDGNQSSDQCLIAVEPKLDASAEAGRQNFAFLSGRQSASPGCPIERCQAEGSDHGTKHCQHQQRPRLRHPSHSPRSHRAVSDRPARRNLNNTAAE